MGDKTYYRVRVRDDIVSCAIMIGIDRLGPARGSLPNPEGPSPHGETSSNHETTNRPTYPPDNSTLSGEGFRIASDQWTGEQEPPTSDILRGTCLIRVGSGRTLGGGIIIYPQSRESIPCTLPIGGVSVLAHPPSIGDIYLSL